MTHRNIALALCLALAGCEARVPQPDPRAVDWQRVKRSGPDEHGVVCYWQGPNTLSCVKVQP